MKKCIFLIVFLPLFYCCQKEKVGTIAPQSFEVYSGHSVRHSSWFENAQDSEDENMDQQLFMLAKGLASFANNNDLMTIIYNQLKSNPDDGIAYSKLINIDSRFHELMNEYLKPNCFPEKPDGHDCYAEVDEAMIYKGVDYYPGIGSPNILSANLNLDPIICVVAEVNDEDAILGLRVHPNGIVTQCLITEQMALNCQNPILIFNNGTDYIDLEGAPNDYPHSADAVPPSIASTILYQWSQYSIKAGYRYESSNISEIKCMLTFYDGNGHVLSGNSYGSSGVAGPITIANEQASDINNSQVFSNQAIDLISGGIGSANFTGFPYMYITIYENDWYVIFGQKITPCSENYTGIHFAGISDPPISHKLRMKYSNEWYFRSFCRIDQPYWFAGSGATYFLSGPPKCTFILKRTQ